MDRFKIPQNNKKKDLKSDIVLIKVILQRKNTNFILLSCSMVSWSFFVPLLLLLPWSCSLRRLRGSFPFPNRMGTIICLINVIFSSIIINKALFGFPSFFTLNFSKILIRDTKTISRSTTFVTNC